MDFPFRGFKWTTSTSPFWHSSAVRLHLRSLGTGKSLSFVRALTMQPVPSVIGGARVVCYTPIDSRHRHTGNTKQIVAGVLLGSAAGLAICQYDGEECFYLFGCDRKWNSLSDTWHEALEDAKEQAEFEYEGTMLTWIAVQI